MPTTSFMNRMRMDGVSKVDIASFSGAVPAGGGAQGVDLTVDKFCKYHRMLRLKMPMKSITNRMKMDGISEAERSAFSGATTAAPPAQSKSDALRELA